jgi:hypothetical protein
VASANPEYHNLVVVADPGTTIWLIDDIWHPVEKGNGTLETSVLHGRYFVELGPSGPRGLAYPIELFGDLRLTQEMLISGPYCQRQSPVMPDENQGLTALAPSRKTRTANSSR